MSSGAVTIAIPTYRRPLRLARAIQSVLDQTYDDVQVCVFDNASCDDTGSMVHELMARDPRIQYFCHPNNIGLIQNANFASLHVRTPYFGLLSDDDYLLPNYVADTMEAFEKHPAIKLAVMSAPAVDERGAVISDQLEHWPKSGFYGAGESILTAVNGHQPVTTTCLFRRELVDEIQLDETAGAISDLPVLIAVMAKYPFHLSKEVGGYFVRHSSATGESFAQLTNVRGLCPAFLRVEQLIKNDPTINAAIKTEIMSALHRRIDRTFFALLIQSLAANNEDTSAYMKEMVSRRSPPRTSWQVASIFVRTLSYILNARFLGGLLGFVRNTVIRFRKVTSREMPV